MVYMLNQIQQHVTRLFGQHSQWLEKQQNTILSAAAIITVFNIISALSGFVRQRVYITQFFDTQYASSKALDALIIGSQIPEMIFQLLIFGAISAAFIPVFIEYRKDSEAEAFKLTRSIMTFFLIAFLVISIPVFIFAEPISALRTGDNFGPSEIAIVAMITRITLASNFLFAISSFYGALLQSYQRFIMPAIAPVIYNVAILVSVWFLAPQFGIYAAAIGMVIGALLHMLIQVPFARRVGFHFGFSFNFRLPGLRQVLKMMPTRIMSISVSEFRSLSLGFFASSIAPSSMLIMQLALSVMTAPIRFFGIPISQAALPFFSEAVAKRDISKLSTLLAQSLNQISFMILPASVLILILRIPIVRLLFGAANFPWQTTVTTGRAVALIAISIAAQALVQLLVRTLYALKDTRTPFIIAVLDMALYLAISYVMTFIWKWGVLGLAIATSTTAILEFFAYLVIVQRRIPFMTNHSFWLPQLKMLTATFMMAVALYLPFRILDQLIFETSRTVELIALTIVTGTVGMVVYIGLALLLDIKELTLFLKIFNSFGPWRKSLAQSPEVVVEPSADTDNL